MTSNSVIKGSRQAYAEAGVDIDAGNALVEAIKPLAKATIRKGADANLGGFGALFDLKAAGYKDPILVSTTDGVGTKLKVAIESDRHETVGIDLVAMCVNDLLVQGAEPLLFLDYFATGKLEVEKARRIIAGIAEGCKQAGAALVGGETAEMPGMYTKGDYDLAGFAVGAVERGHVLPSPDIREGDIVLGLASSGVHSNGFSLVRHIVEKEKLSFLAPAPFEKETPLGEALLRPTRIYVKALLPLVRKDLVKGMAHITGGGLLENIPRVLPEGCGVIINAQSWPVPPVFSWLAKAGSVEPLEMARTFNCGIGMVAIVSPAKVLETKKALEDAGEKVYTIGVVSKSKAEPLVVLENLKDHWPC